MDKLKEQLAPVIRQGFWVLTVLVTIGSLAIWWMASGKLVAEYQTASSKIESDAQRVTSVSSKMAEHPNLETHEQMQKLIKAREQEVLDAWTSVYKRQQEILLWPASLQEDFVREFKDLTPIELAVEFPTPEEKEKESTLLNRYRYYIPAVLPGIAEIAQTKWTADVEKSAGGGGMSGAEYDGGGSGGGPMMYGAGGVPEEGPLVKWETSSQQSLVTDLFPWNGGQPTTLDVLYSQENLWILRQLMQIIASVNGDAGQRFQAKIHEINRIAIGSSVKTTAGSISKPSSDLASGMGGDYMSMGGGDEYMGGDMSSGSMGMDSGMMAGGVALDPGDNRYVDTSGKPLLAATLRSALASKQPADAFMAVAKRVPVMMSFKMDQRAIPDLIAKCGSAQLMVEVKQVRILPSGTSSAAGAGGGDYGGGMESSSGMEGGGYGEGMDSGMGGMTPGPTGATKEQFPLDLDVEVYGIIYVYNPPIAENLGVEKVTEETVIEGQSVLDGSAVAPEAAPVNATPDATVPAGTTVVPAPARDALPTPAVPGAEVSPPAAEAVNAPPAAGASWLPRKRSLELPVRIS